MEERAGCIAMQLFVTSLKLMCQVMLLSLSEIVREASWYGSIHFTCQFYCVRTRHIEDFQNIDSVPRFSTHD